MSLQHIQGKNTMTTETISERCFFGLSIFFLAALTDYFLAFSKLIIIVALLTDENFS
jgi:hypothetical protein